MNRTPAQSTRKQLAEEVAGLKAIVAEKDRIITNITAERDCRVGELGVQVEQLELLVAHLRGTMVLEASELRLLFKNPATWRERSVVNIHCRALEEASSENEDTTETIGGYHASAPPPNQRT